ncbi:DUF4041 domain-containing protein [Acidisoma silvae]|uniref:DUF4041 domain-containing protein n=1 Tax=Acidisoma silvae TaxID=2802396 RepID=A0A963YWK5_9PROT|nr:DUF4041 domain-containing protein [Acidisoma silvae]MCB8878473.1 DUF4041 domain-containing protein [Acidisoma silvae]
MTLALSAPIEIVAAALAVAIIAVVLLAARLRLTSAQLKKANDDAEEERRESIALRNRFLPITNLKDEQERLTSLVESCQNKIAELHGKYEEMRISEEARIQTSLIANEAHLTDLRKDYQEKKSVYDRMLAEMALFDERLAFAEMGVYEPHFDFLDSEQYKAEIEKVRQAQKQLIVQKSAVICTTTWSLNGSQSQGLTMTNRNIRLSLRAFNNECDVVIANTRWNNVKAMENRIVLAKSQLEKLNASNEIKITDQFFQLKLCELFLTHEHREKLKKEREDRAESMRLAREEQRLLRDKEEAEEQEVRYSRLLEKAKAEAADIVGPQLDAYSQKIGDLEKDLAAARAKVVRAQALAERTRSGYVYIVSNIGSFGDGVVKIGLTRRLDPLDRVRELGDASVPFSFDVHAIIYSDDAPVLERALHSAFESTRINVQNYRKEFFRAKIDDVEETVKRLAPTAPFFRDVEAQEYHETLSRRQQALAEPNAREVFPAVL